MNRSEWQEVYRNFRLRRKLTGESLGELFPQLANGDRLKYLQAHKELCDYYGWVFILDRYQV